MTKQIHAISFLLLSAVFINSCNGQNKPVQEETAGKAPRLVKTQGTDRYTETRCALQDKAGNTWFGTTGEGVYRYDGKLFVQFTVKDGLSSNIIWSVLEDKAGNIWFGTQAGLCRYDGKRFTSIPIPVAGGDYFSSAGSATHHQDAVWSMLEDKNGKLWFCTMQGVYCYNGTSFTRFLDHDGVINKDSLQLKAVGYILEDQAGHIWFGSGVAGGDGICVYDGKSITSFKPGGDGWIRYIAEDKNGTIWFGTRSHGNWCYDARGKKSYIPYREKEGIGAPVMVDQAGNIWFSGEEHDNGYAGAGGIWRYDGKTFTNFTTKDGMGDYGVWCMMEDRSGNIWVGTRNTGLYRYDGKRFTCFFGIKE